MEPRRSLHLASLDAVRERRRQRKERRGDSPEKRAARHAPKPDIVDVMLKGGGIDRERRFPKR